MIRKFRGSAMVTMAMLAVLILYELGIQDGTAYYFTRSGSPVVNPDSVSTTEHHEKGQEPLEINLNTTSSPTSIAVPPTPSPSAPSELADGGPLLVPKPGTNNDSFAPDIYYMEPDESGWCEDLYGISYLRNLRDSKTSYCSSSSSSSKRSSSTMTCFGNNLCGGKAQADCEDHFCVVENLAVDMLALPNEPPNEDWNTPAKNETEKPFILDCELEEWGGDSGVTPVSEFRPYMFHTGPHETFRNFIKNVSHPTEEQLGAAHSLCSSSSEKAKPRGGQEQEWYILFKRDGTNAKGSHPWHGGMELFSLFLTLDVLRSRPDPMYSPRSMENAQVVLLDDFPGGDFESLWQVFAKKPVLRLDTLKKKLEAEGRTCLDNAVVPLPGASNPLWAGDWRPHACTRSVLLDTFVNRLLEHYGVKAARPAATEHKGVEDGEEPEPERPLTMTFLNRPRRRRLHDQDRLLDLVRERFPEVDVRLINLWDFPMPERIKVAAETDLLVGVHGSELTFNMFQPAGQSSVVEIQPKGFNHYGFRNVAGLRGQRYFKAHAKIDETVEVEGKDGETVVKEANWQTTLEVTIEDDVWMELIEAGVRSVMERGRTSRDVV
ncbi:glycosyltransferase family 61 protein [Zalerion maritima]|uniref:EGF domain-specific O-linked N-acetylglucosamine transferase n=1 Tax=Zalerion maritima TaxID=339359 RepID=A0AAD5WQ60_9PEZI|nr:glycosyltransferase family 61 protein [Zalerion maritima]